MTRLLYLGFSFPPGVQALHPGINPAGHAFETQMVRELRRRFDIRSATILPLVPPQLDAPDANSGVQHDLLLLDQKPELLHRYKSLARLKGQYRAWKSAGWEPELALVYNLSPVYNNFLCWLKRVSPRTKLVLLLLDSPRLGRKLPAFKRFRYCFKPLEIPDDEMVPLFNGCIGLSNSAEQHFSPHRIPFHWMPGGCTPRRALHEDPGATAEGPIRFGYFGALAPHSGAWLLAETLLSSPLQNPIHICGHGKLAEPLAELAKRDPRLAFHGLLPTPDDCLAWAMRHCDVLVNPRPSGFGNETNFPSKVFDYALCGRTVLSSRMAGADVVLGPDATYFDPSNYAANLIASVETLARSPRLELFQRGKALRERISANYSWPKQADGMADFMSKLLK